MAGRFEIKGEFVKGSSKWGYIDDISKGQSWDPGDVGCSDS